MQVMSTEVALRHPPGPDEPVVIGVDEATLTALLDLKSIYGNVFSAPTPKGGRCYFVNDPEMIWGIPVRNHRKYVKGPGFEPEIDFAVNLRSRQDILMKIRRR
jgi:hypothetical protein